MELNRGRNHKGLLVVDHGLRGNWEVAYTYYPSAVSPHLRAKENSLAGMFTAMTVVPQVTGAILFQGANIEQNLRNIKSKTYVCVWDMCSSLLHHVFSFILYNYTHLHSVLTGALSWSTEKLQTIQVSGSFSVKAGIFRMAERYNTSRWEAGHTLCERSKDLLKI